MARMGTSPALRLEPGLASATPATALPPSSAMPPAHEGREGLRRSLHACAQPLIVLASQLRRAVVAVPEGLKPALVDAVQRFELDLARAGWDERGVTAASYLLCAWVDEVVADTPWGASGSGLLQRFHGEAGSGDRLLRLLSRLAERPDENRELLSLFHACLSLGLHGHVDPGPAGRRQLEQLRARVYLALPRADAPLSPDWSPAVMPGPAPWRRRLLLGGLLLLGGITLGVYTVSHLRLAAQVDEVFASMQRLGDGPAAPPGEPAPPGTPAAPEGPPRLRPLLAADTGDGRLALRDEAHRSVVSIPSDRLFGGSGTRISADGAALLARVGAALAAHPGKVVVVGHTDGSDRRTARLPSAWHQSYEWARETANALARSVPAQRLAIEGAADQDRPPPGASLPRRRVDIVLFP